MDKSVVMWFFKLTISLFMFEGCHSMSKEEKNLLRLKAHEMFHHAYGNYMKHAFPADELMPLSCRGRFRGIEPSRGDIDDALGNFSLSLIDALDTLVVLGDIDEFEKAVRLVVDGVTFDTDIVVSVFETNIRVLGGLLGGHLMALHVNKSGTAMRWYENELLHMASDLGQRLLPAFNTSTGIPFPRVNLRYGVKHELSRTGEEKDTCTACAGSMLLEFSALSRLTGDRVFEDSAVRAMDYLWQSRHRASDLVGMVINIHNGDWVRRDSGVGAGIDSYYEYLLKAYIMLGDEIYLDRFNKHYKAIMKYISNGPLMLDVHMHKPQTTSKNFMDALLAFWPGLQVLKGDLKAAIEMHEMLYQIIQRHNFLPEAFTSDFRVHWGQHPLRPEFVESTYFIYKATDDPYYLEVGKSVIENLEKLARVPCGFAAIRDVTTGVHEDQMDSFVLAETFKYLYLLFSEKEDLVIDVNDYVFTTEAHLLPLFLSGPLPSTYNGSQTNWIRDGTRDLDGDSAIVVDDDDYVCQSSTYLFKSNVDFAHHVRSPLKNMVEQLCPKATNGFRPPRLRASDFIAGNTDHLATLSRMGIKLVTMNDGRVQLLHVSTEASTTEDSNDGMLFMQDMIELSKTQAQDSQDPRVVQLVSHPFLGNDVLRAGPAQFGLNLKGHPGIQAEVVVTEPFRACQAITNPDKLANKIALLERGDCMFIDKARNIQAAGAVGGIVFDNNSHSSAAVMPLFSMSGDGRSDINIPLVFLFGTEAGKLMDALRQYNDLAVYIGETAKRSNDVLMEYLVSNHFKQRLSGGAIHVVDDGNTPTAGGDGSRTESDPSSGNVQVATSDVKRLRVSVQVNVLELVNSEKVAVLTDDDHIFTWQIHTTQTQEGSAARLEQIPVDVSEESSTEDSIMITSTTEGENGATPGEGVDLKVINSQSVLQEQVDAGNLDSSAKFTQTIRSLLSLLNLDQLSRFSEELSTSDVKYGKPDASLDGVSYAKANVRVLRSGDYETQSDDQQQVKAVFDALFWLLQKCTNWNALADIEQLTQTLARLTEFVYTGGKMGFGVQTESAWSQLAQLLTVSDSCKQAINLNLATLDSDGGSIPIFIQPAGVSIESPGPIDSTFMAVKSSIDFEERVVRTIPDIDETMSNAQMIDSKISVYSCSHASLGVACEELVVDVASAQDNFHAKVADTLEIIEPTGTTAESSDDSEESSQQPLIVSPDENQKDPATLDHVRSADLERTVSEP